MILFLHGFNSAGFGQKFTTLTKHFKGEIILAPTYRSHHPDHAIKELQNSIQNLLEHYPKQQLMLVGSSLGGFYGAWLSHYFNLKCVCINPAFNPLSTLKQHAGQQVNFYTGERYILEKNVLQQCENYYLDKSQYNFPMQVFIDKGDEVIDYQSTLSLLPKHLEIITFEGGDHRFQHWVEAIPHLQEFYTRNL